MVAITDMLLVTIIDICFWAIPNQSHRSELITPMMHVNIEISSTDFSFIILKICGIKSADDKPPATYPIISGFIFMIKFNPSRMR